MQVLRLLSLLLRRLASLAGSLLPFSLTDVRDAERDPLLMFNR